MAARGRVWRAGRRVAAADVRHAPLAQPGFPRRRHGGPLRRI